MTLPPGLRRSARGWLPPIAWAIAATVVVLTIAARRDRVHPFTASALWGLCLFASYAGHGTLIARALPSGRAVDFGLRTVWGMAATLLVGGVLTVAGGARRPALLALVVVGVALLGLAIPRRGYRRRAILAVRALAAPGPLVVGAAVAGLAALHFCLAVYDDRYQAPDDLAAYFGFAKKLLTTGTLIEPFSARRLASYGGQSFLQAQLLVVSPLRHLNLFDRGVCMLVLLAAAVGHFSLRRRLPRLLLVILLLFLMLLPDVRLNTASLLSGAALFVGLYRTVDWLEGSDAAVENGCVVGLVAAAACTLRQNYVPAAVLFVGIVYAQYVLRRRSRIALREALVAVSATALALAPWCLLTVRSNRTPFYPLISGYADPSFTPFAASGKLAALRSLVASATYPSPVVLLPLFLIVIAFVRERSDRRAVSAIAGASALTFLMCIRSLGALQQADLARYCAAFMIAVAFAAIVGAADLSLQRDHAPLGVAVVIVLIQLGRVFDTTAATTLATAVAKLESFSKRDPETKSYDDDPASPYVRLQASIPPGARVVAAVEEPYRFDFRRNEIANLDEPGAVGPKPGLDSLKTGAVVRDYFLALGYTHLVFVRPERASLLYSKAHLESLAHGNDPAWRTFAGYVLRFQDRLAELSAACPHLYDDAGLVSLDLTRCKPS